MQVEGSITISKIFLILKQRIGFIIKICVLIPTLFVGLTFIFPYEYQSTATLLPQQESSGGGLSGFIQSLSSAGAGLGLDALGGGKSSGQSRVFADILISRSNINYVINELKLDTISLYKDMDKDEIVKFFQDALTIKLEKSGLVAITTSLKTDYLPNKDKEKYIANLSAQISNTAIKGLDYNVRTKSTSTAKKSKIYLENEIVKYKAKLDTLNFIYEQFQTDNKIIDIEEQGKAIVLQAIEIGTELSKAQSELDLAMYQQNQNSESVKTLKKQVESLKEQYMKIQRGGVTGDDDFSISINKIPELSRQYTNIFRDKKILEQVIVYLETQKFQEAIQAEKDLPVVEALDLATPPVKRSSPRRVIILMISLFASLVFSLIYLIYDANNKGKLVESAE
jgi:capsule polysaccharide export protein KpsE/RkpR